MGAGVVVAASDGEYAQHLVGASQTGGDFVGGAVAADCDDEFMIAVTQSLSDVHRMTRGLGVMEVDVEAGLPQSGLELVPLLD